MSHPISSKVVGGFTQGEAGFMIGGGGGAGIFFFIPSSDPSTVYLYSASTGYTAYGTAFGKGKWIVGVFTNSRFYWDVRNGKQNNLTTDLYKFPRFKYIDNATRTSAANYTILIATNYTYANGMFMVTPYVNTATSTAGDIFTSTTGDADWTTHYGVLPAGIFNWSQPLYNSNTNTWVVVSTQTPYTTASSTNNGASWTTQTNCSVDAAGFAISSSGRIIAPRYTYNTNQVAYSDNNGASWSTASTGSIFNGCYIRAAHWNEADQQFVIAGGFYNGTDFDARIATSPDGVTWTARETGTKKCIISNIYGDNNGNYVAVGAGYSAAFIATNVYLYSTNGGITWTTGTLPASINFGVGFPARISWGDPKDLS